MDTAISIFNYEEVTPRQLAEKVFTFSTEELEMLDIFWIPIFNESWIILERDLITRWFCKSNTEHAVRDFYTRTLFTRDIDSFYIGGDFI